MIFNGKPLFVTAGIDNTVGKQILENVPVELNFADGDQVMNVAEGSLVKSAIIKKPANLIPENIPVGTTIAGIEGTKEMTVDAGESIDCSTLTEIFPVTEITVPEGSDGMVPSTTPIGLEENAFYLILWNGTGYIRKAQAVEYEGLPAIAIGNAAAWGGENTGEPFAIGEVSEEYAQYTGGMRVLIIPMDGSATFSVGGYFITETTLGGGGGDSSDLLAFVTFMNGNTELYKMPVLKGDTCKDPVATGKISKPTKAATVQYTYTYDGWSDTDSGSVNSNILKNITEDKTVYATFKATAILYTIHYYDGDTLVYTEKLWYGAVPTGYTPPDKVGYKFEGWDRPFEAVTGDTAYYAQWRTANRLEDYTWTELSAMSKNGTAKETFTIGDTKTFTMGGRTMTGELIGFDGHGDYTSTTKEDTTTAGMVFWMTTAYEDAVQLDAEGDAYIFTTSTLYPHIRDLIDEVEEELRNVIVPVYKWKHLTNGTQKTAQRLWLIGSGQINTENYTNASGNYISTSIYERFKSENSINDIRNARIRKSADGTTPIEYWTADVGTTMYNLQTYHTCGYVNSNGSYFSYYADTLYVKLQTKTAALVLGFCI